MFESSDLKEFNSHIKACLYKLQLNAEKCKELIIDFKHSKHGFEPSIVNGNLLSVVKHVKILGLNLSNDLQWNVHIGEIIRKANKRICTS
jgi:hypothetical protein